MPLRINNLERTNFLIHQFVRNRTHPAAQVLIGDLQPKYRYNLLLKVALIDQNGNLAQLVEQRTLNP